MEHNFHQLFGQIVNILRTDYAGIGQCADSFTPKYYTQAIGQGWNDGVLDELLFLRYVNQMLACTGDRHLKLSLLPGDGYTPYNPGFSVRRFGDGLYVTEVWLETRLHVGDCITAINGGSPAHHRKAIQKNFFYADCEEREDWNPLLKMADNIEVPGLGTLALQHFPTQSHPRKASLRFVESCAVFDPGDFDGSGDAARLAETHRQALCSAEHIIFDLRRCGGCSEEDFYPLLPYVCTTPHNRRELLGKTELYVNYSPRNTALRIAALNGIEGAEDYIRELREKAGKGFVAEYDEGEDIPVEACAKKVTVLTDVMCRDAGEAFAQTAARAGARLMGRATAGTLDYCGDLQLLLDERYILTWPSAVTRQAFEGDGMKGKGLIPNVYIPFTPEELTRDLLPEAAMK